MMKKEIQEVQHKFLMEIKSIENGNSLEQLRVRFLGRKGLVTALFRQLGQVNEENRPEIGKLLNELRSLVESTLQEKKASSSLERRKDRIDLTLPGRRPPTGRKHPLTLIRDEIKKTFSGMGFSVAEGPDVESDYLNFEALNIPQLHPARDMQDTLYITDDLLLRTHTSPVQIRTMQDQKPPIRIIAMGRVYRRDTPDASHSPFFHQVEGLCVDEGISMGDLKAVLGEFSRQMFGKNTRVRFRPSFFPFTEPSAEMDIWWKTPKGGQWLELLGCGMVHPNVLEGVNIDPQRYSGWAFGVGIDRVALRKYAVDDIRRFFDNDMRFLEQF